MQTRPRRDRRLVMGGAVLVALMALAATVVEAQELKAAKSDWGQKVSLDLSPTTNSGTADRRFRRFDSPFTVQSHLLRTSSLIDVPARRVTTFQGTAKAFRSRKSTITRRVLGGIAGSVIGYFAGGLIGAGLDQNCNGCDSPGLAGFIIGSSIGCPVGATVGVLLAN